MSRPWTCPSIHRTPRAAVLLGLFLLASGCSQEPSPPSVLLITLDTTRADAFGQYGRAAAHTPAFDAWARSGALVRWAIADVPLTLPSHSTLMTGVPALGHGVRTNVDERLGDAAETLAEAFAAAGYRTGAVVSTRVLRRETGIAQGFDDYDDDLSTPYGMIDPARYPEDARWLPPHARRADEAVDHALAWIRKARGQRFCFWLHFFDPHSVYDPPRPWERVEPNLYYAEVEFVDSQLRRLRRELERMGVADSLTVVILADHGEGLDDHREEEHGIFVYDELIRVPLALAAPTLRAGTLLDDQVATIDVAPTILELMGLPDRPGLGSSLVRALTQGGPAPGAVAYCESTRPQRSHAGSPIKALRTRSAKFVWSTRPELYSLDGDPGERDDRASRDEATLARMYAELVATVGAIRDRSVFVAEAPEVDDETRANLSSLGYFGGGGPPAFAEGGRPPLSAELAVGGFDAKDFIDVAMGGRHLDMGLLDDADRVLRRFLDSGPRPDERPEVLPLWSVAHQNLAAIALRRSDPPRAAAEYLEALRFEPGSAAAREGRVSSLNKAGRSAEAIREADGWLVEEPNDWRLRVHRALGLALSGLVDSARVELGTLARSSPQPDVREAALLYEDKLGTSEAEAYLQAYLTSR